MTQPPSAEAGPPRFAIQVGGDGTDAAAVEEFALALQRELNDLGLSRVERVAAGPAPDGARALEIIGLLGFIITAVDAGQAIGKVVSVVRDLARRYGQRRGGVKVTLGGSDVDLATAGADEIGRAVATVLGSLRTNEKGARAALVIANAAYRHPSLTQLRAPGVDAAALAGVLGDPKVGGFEVDRLVDADEGTIRRRLAAFFANRERDDLLLLHFSGHGVKDARGRLYLAAADTDIAALSATAVPASFVNDLIDETQSRRVVLILDCCYSGAFARGATPRADDAVHVRDEFA